MKKRRIYYVLSTHWDREWYQPFQDYRYRLVRLFDGLLDGWKTGTLRGPFVTDGQAILIEDYLEIRPERAGEVARLLAERKIVLGPWYVQPDEFIVSGESLVRNLRLGRETAHRLGAVPSNAGFACDLFGHNSQMPQLFAGFGIRGGFVWRGVNVVRRRHLLWRGADGTEMPCYRFGLRGYCDFAMVLRHIQDAAYALDRGTFFKELDAYVEKEAKESESGPVLLFDGADHQEWDPAMYALLLEWAEHNADRYELIHSDLDAYLDELLEHRRRIRMRVSGELRQAGRHGGEDDAQHQIPGVVSSRVWIKQSNAECQTLLCDWAEPMAAFAHRATGADYPEGFLRVAWKWLLQNHPHDSICGCSLDQVHEDMKYRFSQCRQIADRLTTEALRSLALSIEGDIPENEFRVVVFNPLPRPIRERVDLTLPIPKDWPTFQEYFGYEPKPGFTVHEADGTEIAWQRLGQDMNRVKLRLLYTKFSVAYQTHDVRVCLPLELPAMGYATLRIRRAQPHQTPRHPETPGLATSERSMENEHLALTIESNGTLTLFDKRSGRMTSDLMTFENRADIGDGWFHGPPVNDQIYVSTAAPAAVALVHNGPMMTTFRVRVRFAVPTEFQFGDEMKRSDTLREVELDSHITLRAGSERVEVTTVVHNTAEDHRMRVLFPSGAARATTFLTDTPFDVIERPIALPEEAHLYRELPVETVPQQSWTAVWDGRQGLAIVTAGLHETAVRDLPARPIALTLLRATGRTVMTNGEPRGQLQEPLTFRYWIVPLAEAPDRPALFDAARLLAAGCRATTIYPRDLPADRSSCVQPTAAGFFTLTGPAVMTSCRQVDDALEIRLFNPAARSIAATIRFDVRPRGMAVPQWAQRVNLESEPLEKPVRLRRATHRFTLRAKQIVTLRFTREKPR